jgi:hypothetical protein
MSMYYSEGCCIYGDESFRDLTIVESRSKSEYEISESEVESLLHKCLLKIIV